MRLLSLPLVCAKLFSWKENQEGNTLMGKTQKGEHKPTINGVTKGRPGKGKVLSLGQRKRCYAGHTMSPENTFCYTAKKTKEMPNPLERQWCKKCRSASRALGRARRLEAAKVEARQQEAALKAAMPKAKKRAKRAKRAPKAA